MNSNKDPSDRSYRGSTESRGCFMRPTSRLIAFLTGVIVHQIRFYVLRALHGVKFGQISICDGSVEGNLTFGDREGPLSILHVKNKNFWWRVASSSSLGLAESFMLGEVDVSDMTRFLEVMILNRDYTGDVSNPISLLMSRSAGMLRPSNGLSTSLANVAAHYDISNDVFAAFLSKDMTYSCPIWLSIGDENKNNDTLEKAQLRKIHEVIRQARIKRGDHVLEIGTGWGSFAIEAVRTTGCHVTSLTLSSEQKIEAERLVFAAGLTENIDILLEDYRALVGHGKTFDKVVSIEMLEHVGKDHLVEYFRIVHEVLKRKGGIAVFQTTTVPESRYQSYSRGDDFIRRYIFPGAHIPSLTKLLEAAYVGSGGFFIPDRLMNLGGHYSRCLREWRQNFITNFDSIVGPAMLSKNREMSPAALEQFKRKFIFYFSICEAGFKTKTLGNSLLTLTREGAVETLEEVEL